MVNTMLWQAVETLTKAETKAIQRFLESPYFNRKPSMLLLFNYLAQCKAQKVTPDEKEAFQAISPEAMEYNDQNLRLANSTLLALIERFWVLTNFEQEPISAASRLAVEYRKRHLDKHAAIARKNLKTTLEKSPYRNADYLRTAYEEQLEAYFAASSAKRYEAFQLQEISDLLDQQYLAQKFRLTCMMYSHSAVFKKQYDFGLYQHILSVIQTSPPKAPAISLYYLACRFLSDPAPDHWFNQFLEQLEDGASQFPIEEERDLYLLAINFGIKKCNSEGGTWYASTLQLYQKALERKILLENGILSRFAYSNIVSIALRVGDTKWASQFIDQYRSMLERKYREGSYHLNAARLAYAQKEYGQVLVLLQKADYKDFINAMNAKILQMKVYYEQGEMALLESHLDSMENFIRRQRKVGYHRDNYMNIVKYGKALAKLVPDERQSLYRQIELEKTLTEKEWFLFQLNK